MKKSLYYPQYEELIFTQPLHTVIHSTAKFSTQFPQKILHKNIIFCYFPNKCGYDQ